MSHSHQFWHCFWKEVWVVAFMSHDSCSRECEWYHSYHVFFSLLSYALHKYLCYIILNTNILYDFFKTDRYFLVRWMLQRTLAPSFFFLLLSFFLSAFFVFGLFSYDWSVENATTTVTTTTTTITTTTTTGVCAGMCGCEPVCGCVWVGVGGCGQLCWMNFQNFFWRIESLHQRTLIRILYEFLRIRSMNFSLHYFF